MAQGKSEKSIVKQNTVDQRTLVNGVRSLKFKHESVGDELVINLSSLVAPSGWTNPLPTNVRLQSFPENLLINSSLRGLLDEASDDIGDYLITSEKSIRLLSPSLEGEIFTFVHFNHAISGVLVADVRPATGTGTLLEAQDEFNLGEEVPLNNFANQFPLHVYREVSEFLDETQNYILSQPSNAVTSAVNDLEFNLGTASIISVGEAIIDVVNNLGRTEFVALKKSVVNFSGSFMVNSNGRQAKIVVVRSDGTFYINGSSIPVADDTSHVSAHIKLEIGDYFYIETALNGGTAASGNFSSLAASHRLSFTAIATKRSLIPQKRNASNAEYLLDDSIGDYQMIRSPSGNCQILKFNKVGGVGGDKVMWASIGALAERPNYSVMQYVDKLSSQFETMLIDLAGLTSNPPSKYRDTVPTNADLKSFGDLVHLLRNLYDQSLPLSQYTQTKFQTKILSSPFTGTGNVTDLTFNNLVVGKRYKVVYHIAFTNNSNNQNGIWAGSFQGAIGTLEEWGYSFYTTNQGLTQRKDFSLEFTAVSSQLIFHVSSSRLDSVESASAFIEASSGWQTRAVLEELPNHETTTQWT